MRSRHRGQARFAARMRLPAGPSSRLDCSRTMINAKIDGKITSWHLNPPPTRERVSMPTFDTPLVCADTESDYRNTSWYNQVRRIHLLF